jgi:DNA-binding CsgD family transcriptional regulator/PAS domain-containing protein
MDAGDLHLRLIESLLEAPGDMAAWEAFLHALCTAVDGSSASLISVDLEAQASAIAIHAHSDPFYGQQYNELWVRHDPWAAAARQKGMRAGCVRTGDMLVSPHALRRSAFFNDFGQKCDVTQALWLETEASDTRIGVVSINRGERQARFDEKDMAVLARLEPHIRRALDLHRRLERAQLMANDLATAVESLAAGVMLLTSSGRLGFANRAARAILRERDGLRLSAAELMGDTSEATRALREAIGTAVRLARGDALSSGPTTVVCPRPSGKRAYSVFISPLPSARDGSERQGHSVLVFVTDPDGAPRASASALRALFNLTNAEAALATLLGEGMTVESAAQRLGVTVQTARSRLKIVFQKTGTHRQADLVRLLFTAVPFAR